MRLRSILLVAHGLYDSTRKSILEHAEIISRRGKSEGIKNDRGQLLRGTSRCLADPNTRAKVTKTYKRLHSIDEIRTMRQFTELFSQVRKKAGMNS